MNVTVVKAEKVKDKDNGFAVWKVTAKQADGTTIEAERYSKWPPKEGEAGTIEQSQYGPKFIPAGGGGGGGQKKSDPAERASIEAQVALKAAVDWGRVLAENDDTIPTTDQVVAMTKKFRGALR